MESCWSVGAAGGHHKHHPRREKGTKHLEEQHRRACTAAGVRIWSSQRSVAVYSCTCCCLAHPQPPATHEFACTCLMRSIRAEMHRRSQPLTHQYRATFKARKPVVLRRVLEFAASLSPTPRSDALCDCSTKYLVALLVGGRVGVRGRQHTSCSRSRCRVLFVGTLPSSVAMP